MDFKMCIFTDTAIPVFYIVQDTGKTPKHVWRIYTPNTFFHHPNLLSSPSYFSGFYPNLLRIYQAPNLFRLFSRPPIRLVNFFYPITFQWNNESPLKTLTVTNRSQYRTPSIKASYKLWPYPKCQNIYIKQIHFENICQSCGSMFCKYY